MTYWVMDVANYIIDYCNENQKCISNLKLQKLLYFVQAEFLVAKNEPCFEEPIEAWDFGPVVPDAYYSFCIFGSSIIPAAKNHNYRIKEGDKKLINGIVDACANYSSPTLTEITMNQTPWKKVYINSRRYAAQISNESIYNFFKED